LIADDLLVLITDELLLLLEVLHYLPEGLLQDLNLSLQRFDLLLLLFASLVILIDGAELEHVGALGLLVLLEQTLLLPLLVVQVVPLRHRLLRQLLVLQVDVLLDVQYV